MTTRTIYCCGCGSNVQARLTSGREIYPRRDDLAGIPFWKCDGCQNYVGCHHKTEKPTKPLGVIPTSEIRAARGHIHALIDPIWQRHKMKRKQLYKAISDNLGYQFHTAEIRSIDDARSIYKAIRSMIEKGLLHASS